jgi:hypothetical protein
VPLLKRVVAPGSTRSRWQHQASKPRPQGRHRYRPPRRQPRRQRGARYTSGVAVGHKAHANGRRPQLPARHGQNELELAISRKNWLFAGSERGGQAAAVAFSLIETARLNGVEPWAYLKDVLERIDGHRADRLHELLPMHWKAAAA